MSGRHVADELYHKVGPTSYALVTAWLRDVAATHALDVDGEVGAPSVAWLAEALTFYEPSGPSQATANGTPP